MDNTRGNTQENNQQSDSESQSQSKISKTQDLIIIGSGPSGLTAAIYGARADVKPLVVAGQSFGGQLMQTTDVENFPGFPEGITGPELMDNMIKQAQRFGAQMLYRDVTAVEFNREGRSEHSTSNNNEMHKVMVGEDTYEAKAVIVATGARPRKLNVPGEDDYWGKGVSSCATCDGAFFRGKTVAVIGGGDSAMEEATFLTKFAEKVYVIHRRDELRASQIMQDRARANEKIEFIFNTVVTEVKGQESGALTALTLKDTESGEERELELDGMFLGIGYIPETELFGDYLQVNDQGYAVPAQAGSTKTEIPGIFIAGDVEDYHYRQAITAAGDGCKAALDAEEYLAEIA